MGARAFFRVDTAPEEATANRNEKAHREHYQKTKRMLFSRMLFYVCVALSPFGCPIFVVLFKLRGPVVPPLAFDVLFWLVTVGGAAVLAPTTTPRPHTGRWLRWAPGAVFGFQMLTLVGPRLPSLARSLEAFALWCGVVGAWAAAWALMPVSRASPVLTALGIPVDAALKAHAMLGRLAALCFSCHGVGYTIYWWTDGGWHTASSELTEWSDEGINNLAGVVAFLSLFVAIFLLSHGRVRRVAYALFYRAHVAGFVAFALMGSMHWNYFPYFLAPAITLWVSDLARRALEATVTLDAHLTTYDDARLVKLVVSSFVPPSSAQQLSACLFASRSQCLSVYASVCIPAVAPSEWHAFTLMPTGDRLETWIRARGDWTQQLLALGASPTTEDATRRVEARIAGLSSSGWPLRGRSSGSHVLLVAGGTGVVPLLSALVDHHENATFTLLWVVRHAQDVAILESFCASARSTQRAQTLIVQFTGPEDDVPDVAAALERSNNNTKAAASDAAAAPPLKESPTTARGVAAIRALHGSALGGALVGVVGANFADVGEQDWKLGCTRVVGLSLGATLAAAAACAVLWWWHNSRGGGGAAKGSEDVNYSLTNDDDGTESVNPVRGRAAQEEVKDGDVEPTEKLPDVVTETSPTSTPFWTSVSVRRGRPDMAHEIRTWADLVPCSGSTQKAVLASGPSSLVDAAGRACRDGHRLCCGTAVPRPGSSQEKGIEFSAVSFDMSDL